MGGVVLVDALAAMRSAGAAGTSGRGTLAHVSLHRHPLSCRRAPSKTLPNKPPGSHQRTVQWHSTPDSRSLGICSAAPQGSSDQVYKGIYGDWRLEQSDVDEVQGYRAGLTVAAAALLLDSILAISRGALGGVSPELLRAAEDAIAVAGAAGFGVSLHLIHIYVTPLKRFLQLLWGAGSLGALALMATKPESVAEYVGSHPGAVWAVGPFFAAVTGVAFKEGVCYGKPECAVLFFITPALLLGHLSGLLSGGAESALLLAFNATALIFAARKYTQAIKDDIGDKSVFMFQTLPEEEQARIMAEMERARWTE